MVLAAGCAGGATGGARVGCGSVQISALSTADPTANRPRGAVASCRLWLLEATAGVTWAPHLGRTRVRRHSFLYRARAEAEDIQRQARDTKGACVLFGGDRDTNSKENQEKACRHCDRQPTQQAGHGRPGKNTCCLVPHHAQFCVDLLASRHPRLNKC